MTCDGQPEPPRPTARGRRRCLLWAAIVAWVVATTWPLLPRLGSAVPGHRLEGDVALNLWALAWIYHRLPLGPSGILDANIFFPARGTLALTDLLWGEAAAGLPGLLLGGLAPAYGLAFLLSRLASAVAAAALALYLTRDRWAALFAGLAFSNLPFLSAHVNHLQLQFVGCFPLLVLSLLWMSRAPGFRRGLVVGAVVAAGALFSAYYAVYLGLGAALGLAVLVSGSTALRGRRLLGTLAGLALAGSILSAPAVLPHVLRGSARSVYQAHRSSADPRDYLAWTADPEARAGEERNLALPGVVVGLGLLALWPDRRTALERRLLWTLAGAGFLLSLGTNLGEAYAWLMRLPGFSGIRAPARASIWTAAAATALAAMALARLRRSTAGVGALLTAAALLGAVLGSWNGALPLVEVPPPDPVDGFLAAAPATGAVVHLPAADVPEEWHTLPMLSSRLHFHPLVNGYSGERPPEARRIWRRLDDLPDPGALRFAAGLGVQYAVVHAGSAKDRLRDADPDLVRPVFASGDTRVYELPDATTLGEALAREAPAVPREPGGAEPLRLPFGPGEELHYRILWSGLEAAHLIMAVEEAAGPGQLRLRASAATSAVVRALYEATFESDVVVRRDDLTPVRLRRVTREGARERVDEAAFDREQGLIRAGGLELPWPDRALDPHALLYWLRAERWGPAGTERNLVATDLGDSFDLKTRVTGRSDGAVELDVTAREQRAQGEEQRFQLRIEDGGARRILELRATLPVGEAILRLGTGDRP